MRQDVENRFGGCEEASRLYAAREMTREDVSSFEAHLADCERCRELVGEWKELFAVLSSRAHLEPGPGFDAPVMAFVDRLIERRERARVLSHRGAWAAAVSLATVLFVIVATLRESSVLQTGSARYFVAGTTWIVDALGRGVEWFIFYLTNTVKLGEIFVEVSDTLDPIWRSLWLAAGHVDARLVIMEIVLFMLSLVLFRGLVGTAHKKEFNHVGIIA